MLEPSHLTEGELKPPSTWLPVTALHSKQKRRSLHLASIPILLRGLVLEFGMQHTSPLLIPLQPALQQLLQRPALP